MLLPSMYNIVVYAFGSGIDSKVSRSDVVCRVRTKFERASGSETALVAHTREKSYEELQAGSKE